MISNRVLKSSLIVVHSRAAGRFENPGVVSVLIDGDNLPQSEGVMTPPAPPGMTGLYSHGSYE